MKTLINPRDDHDCDFLTSNYYKLRGDMPWYYFTYVHFLLFHEDLIPRLLSAAFTGCSIDPVFLSNLTRVFVSRKEEFLHGNPQKMIFIFLESTMKKLVLRQSPFKLLERDENIYLQCLDDIMKLIRDKKAIIYMLPDRTYKKRALLRVARGRSNFQWMGPGHVLEMYPNHCLCLHQNDRLAKKTLNIMHQMSKRCAGRLNIAVFERFKHTCCDPDGGRQSALNAIAESKRRKRDA